MSSTLDRTEELDPFEIHAPDGVYVPQRDTGLLCDAAVEHVARRCATNALDLCTGSGAVALRMAEHDASVVAVDIDELAVQAARANLARRGLQTSVRQGDLFAPVEGHEFDLITCNPPYLPAPHGSRCARWDAGPDGRAVVDRVCREARDHLAQSGTLLLVQSDLTGIETTLALLRSRSFRTEIVAEHVGPFGPIASSRRRYLEQLHGPAKVERLVVIAAERR